MRILWIPVIVVLIIVMLVGCQNSSIGLVSAGNTHGSTNITMTITQPQDESIVRSNPVTVSGSVPSVTDVMVNGISVTLENGHFSALVELEMGPNMIEVLARDASGKETSKSINIVYVP